MWWYLKLGYWIIKVFTSNEIPPLATASGVMSNASNWQAKYAIDNNDNTLWYCENQVT